MDKRFKWLKAAAAGFFSGLLGGTFGAGGGIVAVALLKKCGLSAKEAHATSVAVMLALSCLSAALYIAAGRCSISDIKPFLLPGVLGAAAGGAFFCRIKTVWLRRCFGLLLIAAAVRLLVG